ncbi:unnamed protein product, partial [Rotaria magnacalcarata]
MMLILTYRKEGYPIKRLDITDRSDWKVIQHLSNVLEAGDIGKCARFHSCNE